MAGCRPLVSEDFKAGLYTIVLLTLRRLLPWEFAALHLPKLQWFDLCGFGYSLTRWSQLTTLTVWLLMPGVPGRGLEFADGVND